LEESAVSVSLDELRAALEPAARTPLGQKALRGHDEDFDLEIGGSGTFHLSFAGGALEIAQGASPTRQALRYSLVQVDESTLRAIFAGRLSPVEAMEDGKLFLRTRLYGGALLTILFRAAYDLARQAGLAAALEQRA
jgi:hypothetical protein